MGEIRTRDKRDKLRLFAETAKTTGKPLSAVLLASLTECDAAVSNGAFVSSTTDGGGSVGFQILSEYSPVIARRLIGELYDLHDRAIASIEGSPTVDQVVAVMMSALVAIRRHKNDYTAARYGPGQYLSM